MTGNKVSRFATAARNFDVTSPMGGGEKWLGSGRWPVTIEDSDSSKAEATGKIWLTFRSDGGSSYRKGIFVLTRDGSAFSQEMRMLLGATLPDPDAQRAFRDLLSLEDTACRVLESLRGMRVLLELSDGPGYHVTYNVERGLYVGYGEGGDEIGSHREIGTLTAQLKAAGYSRSYREIERIEVLDEDSKTTNLQAFSSVVASIQKSAPAEGDLAAHNFAGYTGPSSR